MVIRLGIIGLSADKSAWATSAHVAPLKAPALSDKYQITAVATSNPESAKAAAEAHGVPANKAYHRPEAIANDPDVDMVVVSVKVPLHKQLTIPALNAKKQVFVEWPLGNGLREAEELAALAKKQGIKTVVGLQARLSPVVQKAKEIIDSGALGRIVNTTCVTSNSMAERLPAKANYINDPKSGASIVSISTIHSLDPILYLLSEFKSLNATTVTTFPNVSFIDAEGKSQSPVKRNFADSISVQGVLESGATLSFVFTSTTDATPGHLQWIISGEKGSLKFEGSNGFIAMAQPTLYQHFAGGNRGSEWYQPKGYEAGGEGWEEVKVGDTVFGGIGEVYGAYAEGKKGYVDFEEAVTRHRLVEAIYRSAEKGTRESY